uniref:GPN-loop GTPase 2 n=1 Tax=Ditylenchus dipsaci TaxID=166011 RepID=A0A915DEX4_9BILA
MAYYGQLVIGAPGAGKTTYCAGLMQLLKQLKRPAVCINLDPANDLLPFQADIDIRELITVEDVMQKLELGPNGALRYCMQTLSKNIEWLKNRLKKYPDRYLVIDMPGQLELYNSDDSITNVIQQFNRWQWRICAIHLSDALYASDPGKFISVVLCALSIMVNLEVAQINVLSKLPDLKQVARLLDDHPALSKYKKMNEELCDVIESYSLVNFVLLDVSSKEKMINLMKMADNANGFSIADSIFIMDHLDVDRSELRYPSSPRYAISDEDSENAATDEPDQFLRPFVRASKEIQTKVRNVEKSINELRAVTEPYTQLSDSLRKLAEKYQQQRRTINQLRTQNQDLQAENKRITESLSKAENEKKCIENTLATAQISKSNVQAQVSTLIKEREGLLKIQASNTQQIASMRTSEHEMSIKNTKLNAELMDQSTYNDELEKKILLERQEWKCLMEQNERDVAKRMEGQKAELERQHGHKLQFEVREYEMKHRLMKKTFEDALKEAELETKKLAAERNEWFAKYNQLVSEIDEKKRRLNADVQKLLSEKWQEMMHSFNCHQATQNTRDANFMIRRPENLASNFLEELIGSSASDSSVFVHDKNDSPENSENVPPVPRASKKISTSARVSSHQPLMHDVVGKRISSHVTPRALRSNTLQRKQVP